MENNKQLIVLMHLAQLLTYAIGFGSLIVPLVIWLLNRDKVNDLDDHGKHIINFQITLFILLLLCVPLIIFLGLGIIGIFVLLVLSVVYPIINAIKASNNQPIHYPFTFAFLK